MKRLDFFFLGGGVEIGRLGFWVGGLEVKGDMAFNILWFLENSHSKFQIHRYNGLEVSIGGLLLGVGG